MIVQTNSRIVLVDIWELQRLVHRRIRQFVKVFNNSLFVKLTKRTHISYMFHFSSAFPVEVSEFFTLDDGQQRKSEITLFLKTNKPLQQTNAFLWRISAGKFVNSNNYQCTSDPGPQNMFWVVFKNCICIRARRSRGHNLQQRSSN